MPLPRQLVEVPIAGLNEGGDPRAIDPGTMTLAVNVEFDKRRALNKRRGYSFVDLSKDVIGFGAEQTFCAMAVYLGEMVFFGHQHLHGLVSADGNAYQSSAQGYTLVQRGKIPRGTLKRQDVASSNSSSTTYEEA